MLGYVAGGNPTRLPEEQDEAPTEIGTRKARPSKPGMLTELDNVALAAGTDASPRQDSANNLDPALAPTAAIAAPTAVQPSPPASMPRSAPQHHSAATVQIRQRRETGASTAGTAGHSSTAHARTASSPLEALHLEEGARTRVFALFCVILDVLGLIGIPLLGGNEVVRNVLMAQLSANLVCALWLVHHLRDPSRFSQGVVLPMAMLAMVTGYTAILYWGVFSAAPAMIVIGLYFFSRSQSLAAALVVYSMAAGLQGGLAFLIMTGIVSDPGLYTGNQQSLLHNLVTQGIIQFLFLAAHTLARKGRRQTLSVIDGLLQAHRQVEQREAALQEVRQDLDRVLQLGGPGRCTDRIVGTYKLGVVVGRGAMGEVYEASHIETGQRAAVKLLHPNVQAYPGAIQRFLREAQAASSIQSPHVVRVLDASPSGAGLPYLVMEFLHGHDLAHHLRRRRRLSPRKMEELARQVAGVLDEAADKGIVHRDIKPQNLFLVESTSKHSHWKVLDFGASKLAETHGTLTEGRVVGTPAYMAPEQARGEEVSPSADVYALAAISYRCLAGRPPFSGKDLPTTLYNVCYSMPPKPSDAAELPTAVDCVLAIGLAKKPSERFETAGEFAEALTAAMSGHRDDWIERRAEALLAELPWGATP